MIVLQNFCIDVISFKCDFRSTYVSTPQFDTRIDFQEAVFTREYLDAQLSIHETGSASRFLVSDRKIHDSRKFFERVAPRDSGSRKNRSRIAAHVSRRLILRRSTRHR